MDCFANTGRSLWKPWAVSGDKESAQVLLSAPGILCTVVALLRAQWPPAFSKEKLPLGSARRKSVVKSSTLSRGGTSISLLPFTFPCFISSSHLHCLILACRVLCSVFLSFTELSVYLSKRQGLGVGQTF